MIPIYMSVADKKAAMVATARLRARADALELRLLAAGSLDVADETGARSTATWLADETREAHGTVRNRAVLATALDERYPHLADALAAGAVNTAQTRAIVESLDALPAAWRTGCSSRPRRSCRKAADLGPRELRHLGRGVLQHLAPDLADEAEAPSARSRGGPRRHGHDPVLPSLWRRQHRHLRPGRRPRRRPAARLPGRDRQPAPGRQRRRLHGAAARPPPRHRLPGHAGEHRSRRTCPPTAAPPPAWW